MLDYTPTKIVASPLDLLVALNPWWSKKSFEAGIRREKYFTKIRKYLGTGEIVVLTGVRRSGKTTLLFQIIDDLIRNRQVDPRSILFVNCDEPEIARLENPLETLLETYRRDVYGGQKAFLILDEIQTVDGWERWVKSLYDRKQFTIVISGSTSCLLDSHLSTLIAGRYLPVRVYPLDFAEYVVFSGESVPHDSVSLASAKYRLLHLLGDYLRGGGFPQVVLQNDEAIRRDQLKAYYDSIVYRDIVRVNEVRNQRALGDLLAYCMTNVTSLYSYRNLQEMLGIDFETVKEYLHYAERAKILFEVQYFSYSLKTQSRNNKKIYCIDNGLRNAVSFRFSEDEGKLAENLVFLELRKRECEVYYWKKQGEVDFVVKNPDRSLTAINVSYTDALADREAEALLEFADLHNAKVRECILLTKDTEKREGAIRYVPLWKWLLGAAR
jgi:predicted AAA+ superfamily ATPase